MIVEIALLCTLFSIAGAAAAAPPPPTTICATNGVLDDTATNCFDKSPDCKTVFTTAFTKSPAARDAKCTQDIYHDLAYKKCPYTCALCCKDSEFECKDALGYETTCQGWKADGMCQSTDKTTKDMMIEKCPGTCGLCMTGACRNTLDNCDEMAMLCTDATAGPVWKDKCPRTCNSCLCRDDHPASLCQQYKDSGFCTSKFYDHGFIARTCGVTCGFC